MELLNDSSTALLLRRTPLTQSQFEQICLRASKNSTNCAQYIQRVLTYVCRRLRLPNPVKSSSPETIGSENTQLSVITLYQLLDQKCLYDFDVATVLNACREEADRAK